MKYKTGDWIRWTSAGDGILAVGQIRRIHICEEGTLWYTTYWEIIGQPKHNIQSHEATVHIIDQSDDIRLVTSAERVLFMEADDDTL